MAQFPPKLVYQTGITTSSQSKRLKDATANAKALEKQRPQAADVRVDELPDKPGR